MYNANSQNTFKTSMLKSNLYDYSDAYILITGTITITGAGADDAAKQGDVVKELIFKNCTTFPWISETNNTQADGSIDSIEYSDKCSTTSGSLWQYYRDEPNDILANSESFEFEVKITGKTTNDGNTKDVKTIKKLK